MSDIIASTYEVIEQIGAGGGGIVYLARHLRLNKQVVLKADKRKITTRPELLRREVDVLKDLSHPYIPQVYDFFEENGTVYTAMDFVDGESLDRPLKEGTRFSQPQVIKWAKQLLQALEYLHSPIHGDPPRGYVHSDIKPANIMRRTNGDICLIDFNISLALGEENIIGASAGYASPEHYGLDFSFSSGTVTQGDSTDTIHDGTTTLTMPEYKTAGKRRAIIPDVRSDIYSIGATLYHLLSGKRPSKNAMDVIPLSGPEISGQLVAIITRAMNPNPDLRYQSAAEMLWDFEHLHENDPRTIRHKRRVRTTAAILAALFLIGGLSTFTGLRRMQQAEAAARAQAEAAEEAERQAKEEERVAKEAEQLAKQALEDIRSSEQAYQEGNIIDAVDYALSAISVESPYFAQAQKALTDALGVYDLSAGFKSHLALTLPGEPIKVAFSPDGERIAALTSGRVTVFNTETGKEIVQLPAESSALADMVFLDNNRLIYAGDGALRAVDLASGQELWSGNAATGIALSADRSTVAAVYRDADQAAIYDAETGALRKTVDFGGKHQSVVVNDVFLDPEDMVFALDGQGRWLAVSFSDGSVTAFCLDGSGEDVELIDPSAYTHFEGGFFGEYFALSAIGGGDSIFSVADLDALVQTFGFSAANTFHVYTDDTGIYVSLDNVLVQVDPETGEQTEAAYTGGSDIANYDCDSQYILTLAEDKSVSVFNRKAELFQTVETDGTADIALLTGQYMVLADQDSPQLRLLRLEDHQDSQLFAYDINYEHDEARVSHDGSTIMFFRYDSFRLYGIDGQVLAETALPEAEQVYDQQYRREDGGSYLDVIYNSGLTRRYSAADGSLVSETQGEVRDNFAEEFLTEKWRIVANLHSAPEIYDRKSGEFIQTLEVDGYPTYVTELGEYLITEYVDTEGVHFGLLLNDNFETLAVLPSLCDILPDGTLVFDDQMGMLRQSRIYSVQELIDLGNKQQEEIQ